MDPVTHLVVAVVFIVAGLVKGISGLGLPTISMALLSLAMSPAKAAMLMVLPSFATNLAQCTGPHWRPLAGRLWPMWACLALLTIFSPFAGLGGEGTHGRRVLGLVLVAYGIWGFFKPVLPRLKRHADALGGLVGALSGVIAAETGVFVIPLVPYLQSLRLSTAAFIQGLGISFMIATVALGLRLGVKHAGELASNIPECALALVAAFLGIRIGISLRGRLNPLQFQRALFGVFVVLGMITTVRSS